MLRTYLPAIASTALFITIGIAFGLLWWAASGRTDMPWWLAILLVAFAGFISDLVEQVLRAHRHRRARPAPSRHRKAV